jgi:hypothetical protein
MWYQQNCINYRAALKADIGTQVVADDPYFGGKVSFLKFLLTLIQTISFNSSHNGGKQPPGFDVRGTKTRENKNRIIGEAIEE